MTQDKELLLQDLCARLSYGVKGQAKGMIKFFSDEEASEEPWTLTNINVQLNTFGADTQTGIPLFNRRLGKCNFKPYLFPLSSITEEQRNDISKLLIDTQNTFSPYGEINTKGCDNLFVCSVKQSNALINYCLMHHLDIYGFIPKGLAIDATGLNIY